MKKIIAAIDYSSTAGNALQFAANLARVFKAELVLFNVYHLSVHASNALVTPTQVDELIVNNENRLEQLADETARKYQIDVDCFSDTGGDTVKELEDYVTSHTADLIVMGMDSNLAAYKVFGNTTTAAIRHLNVPLLVIPNDVPFKGIKKILYACEYAYLSDDNHLDLLKEIIKKFEAQLQIFHVETKERLPVTADDEIGVMNTILGDLDHTFSAVKSSNITAGIIQGVEEWEADLLVMVPHRAGFWELLSKGSATRDMTLRTRVPLLLLPKFD
jgi:nucleotide-binding universal stress UspA family protein